MWYVTPCLGVTDWTKSQSLNTSTILTHPLFVCCCFFVFFALGVKRCFSFVLRGTKQPTPWRRHLSPGFRQVRDRKSEPWSTWLKCLWPGVTGLKVGAYTCVKHPSSTAEAESRNKASPCCATLSKPVNVYETLWQTQVLCSSFEKVKRAHWKLPFKPHKRKKITSEQIYSSELTSPCPSLKGLLRSHRLIKMYEYWLQYLYLTVCMCAHRKADIFSRVGQTELPVICALAWWRGAQSVWPVFTEGSFTSINPSSRRLRLHPLSPDRIIQ